MKIYITSDLHLGHANIIKYCNRPFYDIHDMNKQLIQRWNDRVKEDDIVYHVGDFCFNSSRDGDNGLIYKSNYWEEKLNGTIIHIKGNHDRNNGVKTVINSAICTYGGIDFLMKHRPIDRKEEVPDFCSLVLCGHVHEKWKHKVIDSIPHINISCDVWDFRPENLNGIINYARKEFVL